MQKGLFDEEPQPVQPPAATAAAGETPGDRRGAEMPYTWSEAWRHECEVRYVLTLSPMERRAYLDRVVERRGAERGGKLRKDAEARS